MLTHADHVAAMKAAAAAPPPYERDDDDEATGRALGDRHLEDEIPAEALESYERWRAALEAGEEEAVAIYGQIPHAEFEGVDLHMLPDAMDGGDELALCRAIFGQRFGSCVETLLRDSFCDRLEEYEYARDRLRERLDAGGATESDREVIREDALRRVRDEDLLALSMPWELEEDGSRELRRKIVRGRRDYVCHQTGFAIPAGERHLAVTETCDGEMLKTRHSLSAAWVSVVLDDPSCCEDLRPPAVPLA